MSPGSFLEPVPTVVPEASATAKFTVSKPSKKPPMAICTQSASHTSKKVMEMSPGSSPEHAPTIISEVTPATVKFTVSKPDKKPPMVNRISSGNGDHERKRIASPTPQKVAGASLSEAKGEKR